MEVCDTSVRLGVICGIEIVVTEAQEKNDISSGRVLKAHPVFKMTREEAYAHGVKPGVVLDMLFGEQGELKKEIIDGFFPDSKEMRFKVMTRQRNHPVSPYGVQIDLTVVP